MRSRVEWASGLAQEMAQDGCSSVSAEGAPMATFSSKEWQRFEGGSCQSGQLVSSRSLFREEEDNETEIDRLVACIEIPNSQMRQRLRSGQQSPLRHGTCTLNSDQGAAQCPVSP